MTKFHTTKLQYPVLSFSMFGDKVDYWTLEESAIHRGDYNIILFEESSTTPEQKNIENIVTNGLGYESQTYFLGPKNQFNEKFNEFAKHTDEGLRSHLAELDLAVDLDNNKLRMAVDLYKKFSIDAAKEKIRKLDSSEKRDLRQIYDIMVS